MRILISAYACEPGRGSEPGIGWNWVTQAARFHEVWAITRSNNLSPIQEHVRTRHVPDVHWVGFDLPRGVRFWKRGQRGVHLYYYLWQLGAQRVARRLHAQVHFDVAHHATLGTYWLPSSLARLPVPFLWGPVGGGESAVPAFYSTFDVRGRIHEHARDAARALATRDPLVRATARRARLALATTPETAARLRGLGAREVEVLSHVALPPDDMRVLASVPFRTGQEFRVLSVGRLLHWKGFHLGLAAFAQLRRSVPGSEYHIIGSGPERPRLERLIQQLGLGDSVRFSGEVSRARVLEMLAAADCLLHPSLHESGGWVCAEAMAAGRPVVCLNLGGPGLQVTPATGIAVPPLSVEQVTRDLADALCRLATDEDARRSMGQAARQRVAADFVWTRRGEQLCRLYDRVAA